jgi:glycosyltransferase involved in cell wall biosynthesis
MYLPSYGGAQVGLHEILRHLAAATDRRYTVVTATTDARLPAEEEIDGVEVHRFVRPDRWANWFAPTAAGLRSVPGVVRRLAPDLVHASYVLPTGIGAALAARRLRRPFALSLVGNDVQDPDGEPPAPLRRLAAAVVRRADAVVANSTPVRDAVVARTGRPAGTVEMIPYGVDVERFRRADGRAVRRRLDIPEGATVLLALQRLEPRKDTATLLDAFARAARQDGSIVLVVGGRGREATALEARAASLGIADRVRFAGFVPEDEKVAHYSAADVFVLPSRYEGLGIVLAEAGACGLPVIATAAGGTVDVVAHQGTGLLVPPADPAALARAITTLAGSAELRRRYGSAGRARVVEHFDLRRVAARYDELFGRLLARAAA